MNLISSPVVALQPNREAANSKSVSIIPEETNAALSLGHPSLRQGESELPTRDPCAGLHGRLSFLDHRLPTMGGSASWTTGCPPWEAQLPGPQAAPHGRLGFLDHRQGGETSQPAQTLAMPSSSLVWAAAEAASQVLVSRPSTLSISLSRLENLINGW